MEDPTQAKGSSGAPEQPPVATEPERTADTVSHETHKKLLGEKKRLQEQYAETQRRLAELESEKREREEQALKETNDWKTLAERRQEELETYKSKLQTVEEQRQEARKVDAFLKAATGEIESKYWGLIDTTQIIINPDTGEVDQMSVTKAVEQYTKQYPETIRRPGAPNVPVNSPQGGQTSISYDEWKKLPADKMREHLSSVMKRKE